VATRSQAIQFDMGLRDEFGVDGILKPLFQQTGTVNDAGQATSHRANHPRHRSQKKHGGDGQLNAMGNNIGVYEQAHLSALPV
jgi:hypothetical protein